MVEKHLRDKEVSLHLNEQVREIRQSRAASTLWKWSPPAAASPPTW